MTHPIAISNRELVLSEGLTPLADDEMLRIAGGFAMLGSALAIGCAITGAVIAVAAVAVIVGAAVYMALH